MDEIRSENGVNILSLFDGMACGLAAMIESGVKVNRYIAYEIDKYAVKTSQHNFPFIEHKGDVFDADFTDYLGGIDYLIGGSPCTYWSISQKNNRETEASGLGWELFRQYARALRESEPKFFIYENNKSMSNAIRESITKTFGFEPICINSALVSAQNRQRLYWVGRRNPDGSYSKVEVDQPIDRGILLRDILEYGSCMNETPSKKSRTVDAHIGKLENNLIPQVNHPNPSKQQYDCIVEPVNMTKTGKAQCLRATCYKDGIRNMIGNDVDRRTCVAEKVGFIECQCVCCDCDSAKGYAIPVEFNDDIPTKARSASDGKLHAVYEVCDRNVAVNGKKYEIELPDGYYIFRKLTVLECRRLQTVPDWYEFPVSDTQVYKMLGNGWTCSVISHLINATLANK